jgi:tagatose 6-phosphate kinase
MILTVTLNPAINLTYHVEALVPGATHRVSRADKRLGGKGINAAAVLTQLDLPAVTTGLLRDGPPSFTPIAGPPRRTVVVTDGTSATSFREPGPVVTAAEWAEFTVSFARLAEQAKVVVLAGSLPGGLPDHSYASLIGLARSAGCLTILDTSGAALTHGLTAEPDVVKPSATDQPRLAGRALGRTIVVASDGPNGLTAQGIRARPPHLSGNATGVGVACVAALARGLLLGTPWPALLRDAAALSAAASNAGSVDLALYRELLPQIEVEHL